MKEKILDDKNTSNENNFPLLNVNNLSVLIKDRFLVKNANFTLNYGECWGILGENKSGKTSFIKAISGSLPINPGQVLIEGQDVFYSKKILRKVSTCFDPPVFFKYQTVYENLKYLSALNENVNKEKIVRVLNKFNLAHKLNTRVLFLTYYERKLMGLALGFLTEPKLLLLDEPFKNIPSNSLQMVKNAIHEIKQNGTAIIMTSRNLEIIEDECDGFVFMENRAIREIMQKQESSKIDDLKTFAFVRVKYPHYSGKLIMNQFNLKVKILDKHVLFEADEDLTADIVRFLTKKNIAVYSAGFLSKKAEKVFANLAPYYKEEEVQ